MRTQAFLWGAWGDSPQPSQTQTRRVNSLRLRGGGEAFSPNGVDRSGHPGDCPQWLHVFTQRVHGAIEAGTTRGQGTKEVWVS